MENVIDGDRDAVSWRALRDRSDRGRPLRSRSHRAVGDERIACHALPTERGRHGVRRVAGLGGFRYIDLDTPMLLADDPFTGGYEQRGGIYDVSSVKSGLGIERK